jgi:gamma-glutamylcyclotransferase (GGCT)/AIG2-like uncharacterized protein YtfP
VSAAARTPDAVFVYGTLRPGERNWGPHLARFSLRTEPAVLPGHRLYALEYPCAVGAVEAAPAATRPGEPAGVRGDVVWLDPDRLTEALAHLDWFEDCRPDDPDRALYVREAHEVVTASGQRVISWVYVAGPPQRERLQPHHELPTGEWRS